VRKYNDDTIRLKIIFYKSEYKLMSNNILGKMVCRLILSLNFAGKISSKI
jgi:hypothetical protein